MTRFISYIFAASIALSVTRAAPHPRHGYDDRYPSHVSYHYPHRHPVTVGSDIPPEVFQYFPRGRPKSPFQQFIAKVRNKPPAGKSAPSTSPAGISDPYLVDTFEINLDHVDESASPVPRKRTWLPRFTRKKISSVGESSPSSSPARESASPVGENRPKRTWLPKLWGKKKPPAGESAPSTTPEPTPPTSPGLSPSTHPGSSPSTSPGSTPFTHPGESPPKTSCFATFRAKRVAPRQGRMEYEASLRKEMDWTLRQFQDTPESKSSKRRREKFERALQAKLRKFDATGEC